MSLVGSELARVPCDAAGLEGDEVWECLNDATSSPRAVDPCDSGVDEAGLTTAVDIDVTPMQENIQENAWLALEALTDAHRVLPCAITATEGELAWLPLRAEDDHAIETRFLGALERATEESACPIAPDSEMTLARGISMAEHGLSWLEAQIAWIARQAHALQDMSSDLRERATELSAHHDLVAASFLPRVQSIEAKLVTVVEGLLADIKERVVAVSPVKKGAAKPDYRDSAGDAAADTAAANGDDAAASSPTAESSAPHQAPEQTPKRVNCSKKHPSVSYSVMSSWFEQHHTKPYPNLEEKEELAREAGLEVMPATISPLCTAVTL